MKEEYNHENNNFSEACRVEDAGEKIYEICSSIMKSMTGEKHSVAVENLEKIIEENDTRVTSFAFVFILSQLLEGINKLLSEAA